MRQALAVLAAMMTLGVPGTVLAHSVMMTPLPRDNSDAHKAGPCGAVARTPYCTTYDAGATIDVKWKETVDHTGCFQIAISKANDQAFTILKQIPDLSGTGGMVYPDTVKLPDGYVCKDCTLVVRQLMLGRACVGNGTVGPFENDLDASAGTYYSCADVRIGDPTPCESADAGTDAGDEDATAPTEDASAAEDAGASTGDAAPPSIYSPSGNREDNSADAGCSTTGGATSGISLALALSAAGIFVVRRRRAR